MICHFCEELIDSNEIGAEGEIGGRHVVVCNGCTDEAEATTS